MTKVKKIKRSIKFFFQRLMRGWDDSETWSLDYSISKLLLPRIKRFKILSSAHPVDLSSEEWDKILNDIIFAFEWFSSDERWNIDIHLNDFKSKEKRAKNGMRLFAERFDNLWW